MKRKFAEKKNLPALRQFAIRPRARFPLLGAHPATGKLVVFDHDPRQVRHRVLCWLSLSLRGGLRRLAALQRYISAHRIPQLSGPFNFDWGGDSLRVRLSRWLAVWRRKEMRRLFFGAAGRRVSWRQQRRAQIQA